MWGLPKSASLPSLQVPPSSSLSSAWPLVRAEPRDEPLLRGTRPW
jgi:hypothetical protein